MEDIGGSTGKAPEQDSRHGHPESTAQKEWVLCMYVSISGFVHQCRAAEAALEDADLQLERTLIRAPIPGLAPVER